MELTINHHKKFFTKLPESLEDLLLSENIKNVKGVAVALNKLVIPRNDWPTTLLHTNDTILIITATQGG